MTKTQTASAAFDKTETDNLRIERTRRIFCNRDLRCEAISALGFDMDYTLARYHQEELDALSVRLTLERLVEHRDYPKDILTIEPRPDFAIRGLVIDKKQGNIIKIDSHRHVSAGYHGFRELTDTQRYGYRNESIRLNSDHRFALIDTLFALPEAFLYAALVDYFTNVGTTKDFEELYDDIRFSIDLAHRDGSIKTAIMSDVARFIKAAPELALTLHKFRSAGKKLFLLTNSYAAYTNHVMSYLLEGSLREYKTWQSYFDVTITGGRKPGFFTKSEPFLEVDVENNIVDENVDKLKRGAVYQGGNVLDFERFTGIGGETVCYIGDHIYGDIVRSKKSSAWRTVMIVQEMETELRLSHQLHHDLVRVKEIEDETLRLESEIAFDRNVSDRMEDLIDESSEITVEEARKNLKTARDRMRRELARLLDELEHAEKNFESNFNTYWGLIFKSGNENTMFGAQVEDYACLYTSRVSNFLNYSPNHYFRSPRQLMPHERA